MDGWVSCTELTECDNVHPGTVCHTICDFKAKCRRQLNLCKSFSGVSFFDKIMRYKYIAV